MASKTFKPGDIVEVTSLDKHNEPFVEGIAEVLRKPSNNKSMVYDITFIAHPWKVWRRSLRLSRKLD
jgi:hypothetical protein